MQQPGIKIHVGDLSTPIREPSALCEYEGFLGKQITSAVSTSTDTAGRVGSWALFAAVYAAKYAV